MLSVAHNRMGAGGANRKAGCSSPYHGARIRHRASSSPTGGNRNTGTRFGAVAVATTWWTTNETRLSPAGTGERRPMQNMSSGVHEGVMAEKTGTTPVRSEGETVPAPAPCVDAAGEADCERCQGSGRITLMSAARHGRGRTPSENGVMTHPTCTLSAESSPPAHAGTLRRSPTAAYRADRVQIRWVKRFAR
jgi:hypothetical protein